MASGAAYAKQFNLTPGVALTDAQMAALTSNIVWLVSETVTLPNGSQQTVLVPQVYLAQNMSLAPTGALIAGNTVAIHGTDITNTGGTISGTQQLQLAADHDINNIGGTLSGGNVSLVAGNNILSQSTTNTVISNFGQNSNAVTAVGQVGTIAATNNLVISAGQNLTLQGAQTTAGGSATLMAGNAINVSTVATSNSATISTAHDNLVTKANGVVSSTVTAGGNLSLVSGGDTTLTAANLSSGQDMVVAAGGNLTVQNALTGSSMQGSAHTSNATMSDSQVLQNVVGSNLNAGGNATLLAGAQQNSSGAISLGTVSKDLTLTASTITAGGNTASATATGTGTSTGTPATPTGTLTLGATGNVTLGAAFQQDSYSEQDHTTSHGLLSSSSSSNQVSSASTTAVGSTVSANQVNVTAGNNLTVNGSGIAATNDLSLSAGNNITITTTQSTQQESQTHQSDKSGLMGGGGIGITVGNRSQNNTETSSSVTNNSSTVGSIDGNVTMVAGNAYTQNGSNVMALQGNVGILAKDVTIAAVNDTSAGTQATSFKQSGLTLSVSSPVISDVQNIGQMSTAASQTSDARMKVLAGAAAASDAYKAAGDVSQALQNPSSAVTLSLTVGSSSNESRSAQSGSTVVGSTVQAGGNVTIVATGSGANSNLNVIGSTINAGQNAVLSADGTINITAAQSTSSQTSTSSSHSGAIGVAATYGSGDLAAGITASASGSKGNDNGSSVTNVNSTISAGNTTVLSSGYDTNIIGGVVSGNQVIANVGTGGQGNLNIQSLQDTSTYQSKNSALGGSVTIGAGFAMSANASQSKVNGEFASVGEQSGIKAGDGGFTVNVNGNTNLVGGVIASTATADKNSLTTQTLTQSNIQNQSNYSASGYAVSGGFGVSSNNGNNANSNSTGNGTGSQGSNLMAIQNGSQGTSAGFSDKSGSSSGTSYAGVSAGTINITDDQKQQQLTGQTAAQAIAAINTNPKEVGVTNAGSISQQWNGQQLTSTVQANAQITAAFGSAAAKAIGAYATQTANDLKAQAAVAGQNGNTDQQAQLLAQAANWDEGGSYRVGLHTIVGGLTGNLQGAAGAFTSAEAMPQIAQAISTMGMPDTLAKGVEQVVATALGAVVGGGSGAAAGLNVEANNRQLHQTETQIINSTIAPQYAADHPGMTTDQAAQVLSDQLLRQVDATAGASGGWNQDAANYLNAYASSQPGATVGKDKWGNSVPLFGTAAGYQRLDSTIFTANPQTTMAPPQLGLASIASYFNGVESGAANVVNTLANAIVHPFDTTSSLANATINFFSDPSASMNNSLVTAQTSSRNTLDQAAQGNFSPAGQQVGQQAATTGIGITAGLGTISYFGLANSLTSGTLLDVSSTSLNYGSQISGYGKATLTDIYGNPIPTGIPTSTPTTVAGNAGTAAANTSAAGSAASGSTTTATAGKIFTSTDPLVGETATTINNVLPGVVSDVNVPIKNATLNMSSDADIQLANGDVIEVKSGGGTGATTQVLNQQKIIGDSGEVIVYGPNLKGSVINGLQNAGVNVFTNMTDLLTYIKSKGQ